MKKKAKSKTEAHSPSHGGLVFKKEYAEVCDILEKIKEKYPEMSIIFSMSDEFGAFALYTQAHRAHVGVVMLELNSRYIAKSMEMKGMMEMEEAFKNAGVH